MTRRLHAIIVGRVQGVGFREFVRLEAARRGLTGYVRNGDDGRSVEVVVEGEEPGLEALLRSLYEGPRFSRVESVNVNWSDASGGFSRFGVEM
jgi:acylphosphatase